MSWPVTRLPVDFNLIYRFTTRCFRYVALHLLYQLSYIQTPLLGGSCQLTIAPLETRKILMTLPCLLLMSYLGGSPETTRRVLASIVHEAVAVSILTVLLSFACQATSPSSSQSVRRDRETVNLSGSATGNFVSAPLTVRSSQSEHHTTHGRRNGITRHSRRLEMRSCYSKSILILLGP